MISKDTIFQVTIGIVMTVFGFFVNDIKGDIDSLSEQMTTIHGRVEALRTIQNQGFVGVEENLKPKKQYAR